jgi:hypothetical protein
VKEGWFKTSDFFLEISLLNVLLCLVPFVKEIKEVKGNMKNKGYKRTKHANGCK